MKFDVKASSLESKIITGVNSTWVNFTYYHRDDSYIEYVSRPQNGNWEYYKLSGKTELAFHQQLNRTVDPKLPFLSLSWIEHPTWDEATAGEEFQGWNESYEYERFTEFDKAEENFLDDFSLFIAIPTFVDQPSVFFSQIETLWFAYTRCDVSKLASITWNRSEQSWNTFRRTKLLDNVAYSFQIISDDIYKFTPEWIGAYWFPNEFSKWNGEQWIPRIDINSSYASDYSPVSYGHIYTYFASDDLNLRYSSFLEYCKITQEEFTENSMSLRFEIDITDYERITYHSTTDHFKENPNNGTLRFVYELTFHKDKGYQQSGEVSREYNFGSMGRYYEATIHRPASPSGISGFTYSFLLISVIFLALKKKKRNL
ncbi:MAG: hypothetical protein ACW98I_12290, partial [Candidatus Hodarchaeales archaeon]|jgi:hypothetical protein